MAESLPPLVQRISTLSTRIVRPVAWNRHRQDHSARSRRASTTDGPGPRNLGCNHGVCQKVECRADVILTRALALLTRPARQRRDAACPKLNHPTPGAPRRALVFFTHPTLGAPRRA